MRGLYSSSAKVSETLRRRPGQNKESNYCKCCCLMHTFLLKSGFWDSWKRFLSALIKAGTVTYLLRAANGCLKFAIMLLGGVDTGGGLLRVGVPSSGGEPEGFEVHQGQGQRHLFGFRMRPDGRSRCWKQEGGSLPDRAAVRVGRSWGGGAGAGAGALSEGSGGLGRHCCLLPFAFC